MLIDDDTFRKEILFHKAYFPAFSFFQNLHPGCSLAFVLLLFSSRQTVSPPSGFRTDNFNAVILCGGRMRACVCGVCVRCVCVRVRVRVRCVCSMCMTVCASVYDLITYACLVICKVLL